jgi:hypothetical protein
MDASRNITENIVTFRVVNTVLLTDAMTQVDVQTVVTMAGMATNVINHVILHALMTVVTALAEYVPNVPKQDLDHFVEQQVNVLEFRYFVGLNFQLLSYVRFNHSYKFN